MAIGWRGSSAYGSNVVCDVDYDGSAGRGTYGYTSFGVRPVVSIPASGAPAGLKTALGIND